MIRPLVSSPASLVELPPPHLTRNVWSAVHQEEEFRCCPASTRREQTAGAPIPSYLGLIAQAQT